MDDVTHFFEQKVALIAGRGLGNADIAALREVADCLWYSRHVPDMGRIPVELRADAGYLIDRLTRFNVMDQARESEILAAISPWQDQIEQDAAPTCRDPLAREWGASDDLTSRRLMQLVG